VSDSRSTPGRPTRPASGATAGRPGFAAWRVERVQKDDGRYVLYYSWPDAVPKPGEGTATGKGKAKGDDV